MRLVEKVITEAAEQLERQCEPNKKVLFIPTLDGKTDAYTAKEVVEQARDSHTEIGKALKLGALNLLRKGAR
jgi:hypothetical protein